MIIEFCLVISIVAHLYDCDYKMEFTSLEAIQTKWLEHGHKGNVAGAFYSDEKLIQLHSIKDFTHEYRHAFCYNYWKYHQQENADWCMDPHFKLMRNDYVLAS